MVIGAVASIVGKVGKAVAKKAGKAIASAKEKRDSGDFKNVDVPEIVRPPGNVLPKGTVGPVGGNPLHYGTHLAMKGKSKIKSRRKK